MSCNNNISLTDKFTTKALSPCYICRKLNKWLIENNGFKISKELEYAYYKGERIVPIIACINSQPAPENYFESLLNYSEVISLINQNTGFAEFIYKAQKKIKNKEKKEKC